MFILRPLCNLITLLFTTFLCLCSSLTGKFLSFSTKIHELTLSFLFLELKFTFKKGSDSEFLVFLGALAWDRGDEIIETEVRFLLFEDEVNVCIFEHHFLSFFCQFLKFFVHILDSVETVLVFKVLGDAFELLIVGKGSEKLFIIGFELERIGL